MVNGTPGWGGYYLSAYGLAVKHGFVGSEEEWLDFLKANVELRYENGLLQWCNAGADDWHTLDEFTVFQREIQQKAENAQAAADRADASAEGAEAAKARADASAEGADAAKARADASAVKADASASGADAAAASACASAALADTAAKRADTSAANADAKAQEAQEAADAADTAAQVAQTAADAANTAAGGACAARNAANTAAQNAQGRAREAQEAASAANAAASDADHAARAANMAAPAANTAAQNAQIQADYAKNQGDRADELLGKIEESDVGGLAADVLELQSGKAAADLSNVPDEDFTTKANSAGIAGVGKKGSGENSEIFNDYRERTYTQTGAVSEGNTAYGIYAHAEGEGTTAAGANSHAEGQFTLATGIYSHAEGGISEAAGKGSHAEGQSTVAAGPYSHVQGKYNLKDTNSKYAHIVGNGSEDNARSNAHTLDWEGNAWFAGEVTDGHGNSLSNVSRRPVAFSVKPADWTAGTAEVYPWIASIAIPGITSKDIVDVYFDFGSYQTAVADGVMGFTETGDDETVVLVSEELPTKILRGNYVVTRGAPA